jgi:hypothetical protein
MSTEPGEAQPPGDGVQPSVARETTTFALATVDCLRGSSPVS